MCVQRYWPPKTKAAKPQTMTKTNPAFCSRESFVPALVLSTWRSSSIDVEIIPRVYRGPLSLSSSLPLLKPLALRFSKLPKRAISSKADSSPIANRRRLQVMGRRQYVLANRSSPGRINPPVEFFQINFSLPAKLEYLRTFPCRRPIASGASVYVYGQKPT